MKTVVVTGGAGFIGSHVCKALFVNGFTPISLDNLSTGNRAAVKWGDLVERDIRDTEGVTKILLDASPVAVLHFAASAYVGESITNPKKYYENNVIGTLSLMGAMKNAGIGNLVFSSSCATYGIPKTSMIGETHPQSPISPYGQTKLICESAIKDYEQAGYLRYAILRYFNAAGADAALEVGELHNPETHVIPLAIDAAFSQKPFFLNGVNLQTKDGTAVRDYIHVTDLAMGHVAALQRLVKKNKSFDLNLGSGKGVSIKELISEIENCSGYKVDISPLERRIGDPDALVADISKATDFLEWRPSNSSLRNIVETAIAWYKNPEF